ncbi:MFS transporter [Butyrivibrio sp. AE2032]|uniref:MFS transporter n=1 Tax=Butyrivibrio sp. AE2032 TaxID=1458463 RepID=UPI000553A1BC|nr:MFS transporter [Butyrivibrio sp. AE2032]
MFTFQTIKDLKTFLILWFSQIVSELGTAMTDYALVIWVYEQKGTASSVTLLTLCIFLPTIFFRFIAGTVADRQNKKLIMLLSDLVAALGTLIIFALYSVSSLAVWHLYIINTLMSLMNSFQVPASFVATSLLVPEKYYTKASGLQGISGSVVSILAPALGSVLIAFGGIKTVLIIDLISFGFAFVVLMFFIRIPEPVGNEENSVPFIRSCLDGIHFLKEHKALLHLTFFVAVINFFAKLGGDGMMAPFVLGRTGNDQRILGIVQSSVSAGLLIGSIISTVMKPVKKKCRFVFITCALIFTGNIINGLTISPVIWCISNIGTYVTAVIMNVNLTTVMREKVPVEMQGRVTSAQDTLKNFTIPLGLFLGGILADNVFEPFMENENILSGIFGTGHGAGIALIFFISGLSGMIISLIRLTKPVYKDLDK